MPATRKALDHHHPVNIAHFAQRSLGACLADTAAKRVGSWPFIIIQSCLLIRLLNHKGFDPYSSLP